jgi:hypothetical protein
MASCKASPEMACAQPNDVTRFAVRMQTDISTTTWH